MATAAIGFAYVDETEGGDARFLLSGSSYKLDNPQISISDIRGRSAKATWTSVKYAKSYNVTLMQNGKALENLSTEGNEIEFDGLEPQTEYTAVVQAALADYVSDSVKVNFTTSELNFDERKVNAKSLLGVLSLGIVKGTTITLIADGADEKEAISALVELVKDNFGE